MTLLQSPLILASITDPIVNFAVDVVDAIGVVGIFILMTLESACVPIPSEATMLFAGFAVSDGDMTLFAAVAAGVLGNLLGSWIAWAAGYYGREELLEKNRLIHINPKHLETADRWFREHGDATVFWARMLPIVRTFISLPAGVAEMPFWRFTTFTVARLHPLGPRADPDRPLRRRQLGRVEGQAPLRRLPGRGPDRARASPTSCSGTGAGAGPAGRTRGSGGPGLSRSGE